MSVSRRLPVLCSKNIMRVFGRHSHKTKKIKDNISTFYSDHEVFT